MASSASHKFAIETSKVQKCFNEGEHYQKELITAEDEQSHAKVALEETRTKVNYHKEEWHKALKEANVKIEKYLTAVNSTANIRHELQERQIQLRNLLGLYTEQIKVFDDTKDREYTRENLDELKQQTQHFLSELGVFCFCSPKQMCTCTSSSLHSFGHCGVSANSGFK